LFEGINQKRQKPKEFHCTESELIEATQRKAREVEFDLSTKAAQLIEVMNGKRPNHGFCGSAKPA
jgi:hypothetical protein